MSHSSTSLHCLSTSSDCFLEVIFRSFVWSILIFAAFFSLNIQTNRNFPLIRSRRIKNMAWHLSPHNSSTSALRLFTLRLCFLSQTFWLSIFGNKNWTFFDLKSGLSPFPSCLGAYSPFRVLFDTFWSSKCSKLENENFKKINNQNVCPQFPGSQFLFSRLIDFVFPALFSLNIEHGFNSDHI